MNIKTLSLIGLCSCALALSGCATRPSDVSAQPVPPSMFSSYNCSQLAAEQTSINQQVIKTSDNMSSTANVDDAEAIGGIFFFPAWFFMHGNADKTAHYELLKGEYSACHQEMILKNCFSNQLPVPINK